jgi:hypothetical protein
LSKDELTVRFRNWCRVKSAHETLDPAQPQAWGEAEDQAFQHCVLYFEG